jgi:hypothetical protein
MHLLKRGVKNLRHLCGLTLIADGDVRPIGAGKIAVTPGTPQQKTPIAMVSNSFEKRWLGKTAYYPIIFSLGVISGS